MEATVRAALRNAGCVVTSSTFSAPMYTTRPSRICLRCSLPLLSILVVVDLVEDAATARGEGAVVHAGWPAGVRGRQALLAALSLRVVAHDQVPLHHIDLFPMVVHERLGGKSAGVDLQQPRAAALFRLLVEIGGEDLLPEARRIARRALPARGEVYLYEFEM